MLFMFKKSKYIELKLKYKNMKYNTQHKTVIFFTVLSFFVYGCNEIYNMVNEPNRILSLYTIGDKFESLNINESKIIFQFENHKEWNNSDMNIILKGYSLPKKFIKNNQKVIIVDKGEYAVYLYFNFKNVLVDKEIVGT